jgi:hypothetical protein
VTAELAGLAKFLNDPAKRRISAKVKTFLEKLQLARSYETKRNDEFGPRYGRAPRVFRWLRRAICPVSTQPEIWWVLGSIMWIESHAYLSETNSWIHNCIDLDRNRLLGRIRKCEREGCGLWFAARRKDKKFCGPECKQRAFRSTPRYRKKARIYMRKYMARTGSSGR